MSSKSENITYNSMTQSYRFDNGKEYFPFEEAAAIVSEKYLLYIGKYHQHADVMDAAIEQDILTEDDVERLIDDDYVYFNEKQGIVSEGGFMYRKIDKFITSRVINLKRLTPKYP